MFRAIRSSVLFLLNPGFPQVAFGGGLSWLLVGTVLEAADLSWSAIPAGRTAQLQFSKGSARSGFTLLPSEVTRVAFTNLLSDREAALNQIRLNGSGVALGDVNHDGLCDLYLCGLENSNALFLNLGGWRFTNLTETAGVGCGGQFSTGTAFADVDADGDLDLLVNGIGVGTRLFFNDGQARFSESLNSGLMRTRGATSMALGDVEGDGDLDLYVANYRSQTIRSTGFALLNIDGKKVIRREDRGVLEMTPEGRLLEHGEPDILYLNDGNGHFSAVEWTGGSFREFLGQPLAEPPRDWGLSAVFRDFNQDGAPDLYVCNDFHSPDRIWLNDGQGTFTAAAPMALRHTPTFSMSIDVADINRDGLDDWFVADMLSRSQPTRLMRLAAADPYFSEVGRFDDRPQFDQNALFLNRGDGTWTDIACLAGVEATDWTWSAAFLDVDLDGYEDLLCTTGHAFDIQDLDAEQRMASRGPRPRDQIPFKLLEFPRLKQRRHAFRNQGNLSFADHAAAWGFDQVGVAHGMAFADLDNDGDLDVVVNNLNDAVGLYRNDAEAPRVGVRLKGAGGNRYGIGARIHVQGAGVAQSQEMMCGGRYLSSDDTMRTFAASEGAAMEIRVRWRSGKESFVREAKANNVYEVDEASAKPPAAGNPAVQRQPPLFEDVTAKLRHRHLEQPFDDFTRQPLLPRKLSQAGPGLAWVDADADGKPTLIIGTGAGGQPEAFTFRSDGTFVRRTNLLPNALFDHDLTAVIGARILPGSDVTWPSPVILIAQSSYESPLVASNVIRAFGFSQPDSRVVFPEVESSVGPMAMADVDGDGDLDLFVGGRVQPGKWPAAASSFLFRWEEGTYQLDQKAGQILKDVGLVSGGLFTDIDGDGDPDLVLACEWGPIRVFANEKGRLSETTAAWGLSEFTGWWNGVSAGDFDADGLMDLVASNWGWNDGMAIRNGVRSEVVVAHADLDRNGLWDVMQGTVDPGSHTVLPVRSFRAAANALPFLQERFSTFASYNQATLDQVLGESAAKVARVRANWFASTVFMNRKGKFEASALPIAAQFAPSFGVCVADFDNDGNEDVFLAQNFFPLEPTAARLDGGLGVVLLGDGAGGFRALSTQASGIRIFGEGRGAATADYDGDGAVDLAVGQNGASTKLFHNRSSAAGLTVQLVGTGANVDAIGASVRLIYPDRMGPRREIRCGGGYWSQDHLLAVLGLGGSPTGIEVRWPDGKLERSPIAAGSRTASARRVVLRR